MDYEIGKRLDKIETGIQLILEKVCPELFKDIKEENESKKSAI